MLKAMKIFFIIFFSLLFNFQTFAKEEEAVNFENMPNIQEIYEMAENEEYLKALSKIKLLPENNDTKILKAKIYLDLNMHSDAEKALENTTGDEAETLKYIVKREKGFLFFPNFMLYDQELSDEYDLDYERYGLYLSEKTPNNSNIYFDYALYFYRSGKELGQANLTNEIIGGYHAKPNEKVEYNINLGVKNFQFDAGNMLITDSWVKYYQSDKIYWKLGFLRDNVEQSFTSAVGVYDHSNTFIGQVAENKFYADCNFKLPYKIKGKIRAAYGLMTAQHLPTNQYLDGYIKFEKNVYKNPQKKFFQKVDIGLITQAYAYQYDLLNLYDNRGFLFGGYFSPSFYNAVLGDINIEGQNDNLGLHYGLKGFVGEQLSFTPDFIRLAWGFAPYIEYNLNNHVALNLSYIFTQYADSQRHILFFNTIFRGFRK